MFALSCVSSLALDFLASSVPCGYSSQNSSHYYLGFCLSLQENPEFSFALTLVPTMLPHPSSLSEDLGPTWEQPRELLREAELQFPKALGCAGPWGPLLSPIFLGA